MRKPNCRYFEFLPKYRFLPFEHHVYIEIPEDGMARYVDNYRFKPFFSPWGTDRYDENFIYKGEILKNFVESGIVTEI